MTFESIFLAVVECPIDAVFYIYPSRPLKCCSQNKCTWGEMLCSIHPELFSFCFVVIVYLTFCFATLFVSSFAKLLNQLHSDSPNSSCSSARLFGFACNILFSPLKVDSSPHPTALVVVLLAIKGLAIQRSTKKLNWSWVVLSSRHRRI